ncbi:MAG: creatininase family protein [Chloroflexota bacterium]|jgi:creatinine amidohydrolase
MQLGHLPWTEVPKHSHKVAVVPIGAFEQHGHHLPMLTDSMICGEIVKRAEAELGDEAVFLPLLYLGSSDHHRAFTGTISLKWDTYVHVLVDIVESLIGAGFRKIFLINAHGGNIVPGQTALYEVNLRHFKDKPDLFLTFVSWFDLARKQVAALDGVKQDSVLHACEWETSAIMALHPDLVRGEAIKTVRTPFDSRFWSPDHLGPTRVHVARTLDQSSPVGALGYPAESSADKGARIIAAATAEVVAFVREFATWQRPVHEIVS